MGTESTEDDLDCLRLEMEVIPGPELDQLALAGARGDREAAQRAIRGVTAMAVSFAERLARRHDRARVHRDEIVQEGLRAAVEYLPHYDGRVRFSTYMWPCVSGQQVRFVQTLFSPALAHVPHGQFKGGKEPVNDLSDPVFQEPKNINARRRGSGTRGVCGEEEDHPPDHRDLDRRERAEAAEHAKVNLRKILRRLTPIQRQIVTLRRGLEGGTPMGLKEIGVILGLCMERVRQIEADAMRRLAQLARIFTEDYAP